MKRLLNNYLSLVKNFIPEKKRTTKPTIGLDIGAYSCKAIELIPTEDSFEILNWAIEPIGPSDATEAIKRVFNKFNIESKNVSTAISGQGTLIRHIDMPKMSLADAKKSFYIEADKYFPFAKDQIYTDCFVVDSIDQDNKMSLLVAAAKKEIVEQRIQLLSNMSQPVDFIGINSIAIANVFNVLGENAKKTENTIEGDRGSSAIAILDIGDAVTSLIILKEN